MKLEALKVLYEKGQYHDLLNQLAQLNKDGEYSLFPIANQIECIYYKSRALVRLGHYKEALDTVTQTHSTILPPEDRSLTLALLVAQISPLISMGRLQEAMAVIEKGEAISNAMTPEEKARGAQWIRAFLHRKSVVLGRRGDFHKALEYCQRSLALREALGISQGIAETLRQIGGIYWTMGELELSLTHLQRSLSVSESTGNPFDIARALNHIGLVYQDRGELNTALEYYYRSLTFFETIGNPLSNAICLTNIGRIYRDKGELDQALECLKQSLSLMESIGIPERIATTLANIGSVYWKKGDLEAAEEHLKQSLDMREVVGTDLYKSHHLFYLLRVSLDQKNQSKAQAYLSQLKDHHKQSPNKMCYLHYRLGEALVLKASRRFINRAQAQRILTEIVEEEELAMIYGQLVTIHLCELLLDELKAYGEYDVFLEAKSLVRRLYKQSQREHSFPLVVNSLILRAKFALVEGDLVESTRLLDQAIDIADEKGLGLFTERVFFEKQRLEEQVDTWYQLIQSNAPLQQRLKQAKLAEYIKSAAKLVSIEK